MPFSRTARPQNLTHPRSRPHPCQYPSAQNGSHSCTPACRRAPSAPLPSFFSVPRWHYSENFGPPNEALLSKTTPTSPGHVFSVLPASPVPPSKTFCPQTQSFDPKRTQTCLSSCTLLAPPSSFPLLVWSTSHWPRTTNSLSTSVRFSFKFRISLKN